MLDPLGTGFGRPCLRLQQFLKPAGIGVCGHASGYSWKRRGDVQALPQLVGAPECALPRLFILACINDLIAMPAEEKTMREEQRGTARYGTNRWRNQEAVG
jgi:hypothetical protein